MSSSDEAPEEVTFDAAKLSTRLSEKKRQLAQLEQQRRSKQKRRDRDAKLKQTSSRKKLLSEILQESESEEEPEPGALPIEIRSAQKKTFEDRDGFRIQIVEKPSRVTKKKRLPPAGSAAVKRKEAFLFREAVPRR